MNHRRDECFAIIMKGFAIIVKGFAIIVKGFAIIVKGFAIIVKDFTLRIWQRARGSVRALSSCGQIRKKLPGYLENRMRTGLLAYRSWERMQH